MWFYVFVVVCIIILSLTVHRVIDLYNRVKNAPKKREALYYEHVFAFTSVWSIAEDLMRWRNKLTTVQERHGKIAVITGGARGIGLHVSTGLLKHGIDLIIGVRNIDKTKETLENLRQQFPNRNITVLKLDVSSMNSVRDFAKIVSDKHEQIHMLINNAGVLFGDYKITEDGFENQLATNYLGHFLLTHLLMENLKRGGAAEPHFSRIVNVSSATHYGAEIFLDDINMKNNYFPVTAYCHSKLAQLMSSHYLNTLLKIDQAPVRCYSVHPGIVTPEMFFEVNGHSDLVQYVAKSPAQGAVVILYACLSPDLEKSTDQKLYSNCREGFSSEYSKQRRTQKKLFTLTLDMLQIQKFGEPNVI